jgi:uncharacterized protein
MPSRLSFTLRLAATLAAATAAALLCRWLRTPIPWMIGPLVITSALTMAGARTTASEPLRNAALWTIGTALGVYFTPQVVSLMAGLWWAIVLGVLWAFAIGLGFGALLLRLNRQHIPGLQGPQGLATIFCATTIGGASEMALMAERLGARMDLVASAHSLRLMLVVLLIPFGVTWLDLHGIDTSLPGVREVRWPGLLWLGLATGATGWAFARLQWSNPWMMGSMLCAIALTLLSGPWSAVPSELGNAAQLIIGAHLGTKFTPAFTKAAPRWLSTVALGTILMIAACALFAWVLAQLSGLHPVSLLLATAPGGITEMAITAKVLQLGVPVVTAFHVMRLVSVMLLAPLLYPLWARHMLRTAPA